MAARPKHPMKRLQYAALLTVQLLAPDDRRGGGRGQNAILADNHLKFMWQCTSVCRTCTIAVFLRYITQRYEYFFVMFRCP